MGRLEEAENEYKLALAADPKDLATHSSYGIFLHKTNRLEEAEKHYRFVLDTTLEYKIINHNYIILLYNMDRLKDGIKQCKIILKNDPKDADIHFLYGLTMSSLSGFSDRKIKKEMDLASYLMEKNRNPFDAHNSRAQIYAALANKYYQHANKYPIPYTYSKSWKYAENAGEEFIEASKHAREESKGEYLTKGYIYKGRAKVREVVIYSPSDCASFKKIVLGIYEASEFYKKAADASLSENKFCNACYLSMSVFAEMLQSMKAVIEKGTFPQLQYFTNWIGKSSSFIPNSKYFSVKWLKS
jgi:hypothetical protein